MDLSLLQSLYIFFAAFIGETFGTMFGGGSFFIQPALLAAKIPANIAVANDITAAAFASLAFLYFYRKEKKQLTFDQFKKITFFMAPALIIGAMTGGYILSLIPEEFLKWVVIAICSLGLIYMIHQMIKRSELNFKASDHYIKHWKIIALIAGLGLGLYDGISGAGSGILIILILGFIFRQDMKTTLVMANILSTISLFSAAIVFLCVGLISWQLQIFMIPACTAAGFFGARIVSFVSEKTLRLVYIFLVFLLLVYMIKDMLV
jgi:uncharacterized membrane protein YfcA